MAYNFYVHSNLFFGKDAVENLPALIEETGAKRIMIIYDSGVKAAGISEKVIAQAEKSGAEITTFDGVIPNPTDDLVEDVAVIAIEKDIEAFVAVGGGSSIDLAKAVNVLMTNPGPINQYGGIGNVKNNVLPLIAIPTTAGTSSEITNVSALIDQKNVCKYVVIDNKIVPSHVIIDPEFTKTMPPSVTAGTGMDAITHALESYISNMATPLTEYNSLTGFKILLENLPKVMENGSDMAARENMLLGCVITGFGFSNANLGLVHAIAHTLSAHFGMAHGTANATVLPYVMEFNAPACKEKMIELARYAGLTLSGDDEKDMYIIAETTKNLSKQCGIKTLSEYGISAADVDMLAAETLKEPVLGFNPRQGVTAEDVKAIILKAL